MAQGHREVAERFHPFAPPGAAAAVGRDQQVLELRGRKSFTLARLAPAGEFEVRRVFLEEFLQPLFAGGAAENRRAQLREVVRGGDGDHEAPVVGEDPRALGGIAPRGDRQHKVERAVGQREAAICVGDKPEHAGVAPRREIDCAHRQVDPGRFQVEPRGERADEGTLAGADVECAGPRRQAEPGDQRSERREQGRAGTGIEQPAPRRDGRGGVARFARAAVLRLHQVDVAAARNVEAMPAGAAQHGSCATTGRAAIRGCGGDGAAAAPHGTAQHEHGAQGSTGRRRAGVCGCGATAALAASVFKQERGDIIAAGLDDIVHTPDRPQEIFECLQRLFGEGLARQAHLCQYTGMLRIISDRPGAP